MNVEEVVLFWVGRTVSELVGNKFCEAEEAEAEDK